MARRTSALVRFGRRLAAFFAECDYAQRRLMALMTTPDTYLADRDKAPDDYADSFSGPRARCCASRPRSAAPTAARSASPASAAQTPAAQTPAAQTSAAQPQEYSASMSSAKSLASTLLRMPILTLS